MKVIYLSNTEIELIDLDIGNVPFMSYLKKRGLDRQKQVFSYSDR